MTPHVESTIDGDMTSGGDISPHSAPSPDIARRQANLAKLFAGLSADASQFDFYYAMRYIDANMDSDMPLGRAPRPRYEPLRMTQEPSLVFAPTTLHKYREDAAVNGLGRLSVFHFGLFGPNGALPQHLTEYVQERILHYKDETIARFCDIFQHRMILLFYRAWADCQAAASLDRPNRDHFGRYASSLVGLGQTSLQNRDSVPDHMKLHHSGHLVRLTRNPEGLTRPLAALLRVPVSVQEYCIQWLRLAEGDRTRLSSVAIAGDGGHHRIELGSASSCLGQGAIAGAKVPDAQHKFRLRVGAMSLAEFQRYLPGGVRFSQVRDWVRNYVGVELAWDVQVVLKKEEIPASRLGSFGQLGWTSWLGMPAERRNRDADDVILDAERLTNVRVA